MSLRRREDGLETAKRAGSNVAVGARRHCDGIVVMLICKMLQEEMPRRMFCSSSECGFAFARQGS